MRTKFCLIFMVMIFTVSQATVFSEPSIEKTLFLNENFDNENVGETPSGWNDNVYNNRNLTIVKENENNFLRINKEENQGLPVVRKTLEQPITFDDTDKMYIIESNIRSGSENFRKYLRLNTPFDNNDFINHGGYAVMVFQNNKFVQINNGKGTIDTKKEITPDKWYKFRIVFIPALEKVIYYFGDENDFSSCSLDKIQMFEYSFDVKNIKTLNCLTWSFRNNGTGTETFDIDDFKVYSKNAVGNYDAIDDFSDVSNLWSDKPNRDNLCIANEGDNQFMRIIKDSQHTTTPWVTKNLETPIITNFQKRPIIITTKMRTNGFGNRKHLRMNIGDKASDVAYDGLYGLIGIEKSGNFSVPDGNFDEGSAKYKSLDDFKCEANKWYDIEIVIYPQIKQMWYFINGEKVVVENNSFFNFFKEHGDLSVIEDFNWTFREDGVSDERLDVDDFKVAEYKQPEVSFKQDNQEIADGTSELNLSFSSPIDKTSLENAVVLTDITSQKIIETEYKFKDNIYTIIPKEKFENLHKYEISVANTIRADIDVSNVPNAEDMLKESKTFKFSVAPSNLIKNYGFENSDTSMWSDIIIDSNDAYKGNFSAKVSSGEISQNVILEKGKYLFSIWVKGDSDFKIMLENKEIYTSKASLEWQQLTGIVESENTSGTKLKICSQNSFLVDNVYIYFLEVKNKDIAGNDIVIVPNDKTFEYKYTFNVFNQLDSTVGFENIPRDWKCDNIKGVSITKDGILKISNEAINNDFSISASVVLENGKAQTVSKQIKLLKMNIKTDGIIANDETISASYDFVPVYKPDIKEQIFTWQVSNEEDGEYSVVATENKYKFKKADEQKYFKVKIKTEEKNGNIYEQESLPFSGPIIPYAQDVGISGNRTVGSVISGTYKYAHKYENAEAKSEYKWYVDNVLVSQNIEYTVTQNDKGSNIVFEVTPICKYPPYRGEAVKSQAITIESSNSNSGSSSGGGTSGNWHEKKSEENKPPKNDILKFSDIVGHWAENEINKLYNKKIVNGDANAHFNPDNNITRAEVVTMLVRAFNLKSEKNSVSFSDVGENDWFRENVLIIANLGIIKGYDGKFNPLNEITREEMVVMISNTCTKLGIYATQKNNQIFDDSENISNWAISSIENSLNLGIIKGRNENLFEPKQNITRAEAVVMINRVIELQNKEGSNDETNK